jgi:hypothetical protein
MRHPKPTRSQNVGRVIRKAAKILEDREWGQGTDIQTSTDGIYRMCTRGVINFAILGVTQMHSARILTLKKQSNLIELAWDSVTAFSNWLKENRYGPDTVFWNDAKGRTKEEVIAYLNKFADEKDPQCL